MSQVEGEFLQERSMILRLTLDYFQDLGLAILYSNVFLLRPHSLPKFHEGASTGQHFDRIQHLSLTGSEFRLDLENVGGKWAQLILKMCRNLTALRVDCPTPGGILPTQFTTMDLTLQYLHVHSLWNSDPAFFVAAQRFQNVQKLSLTFLLRTGLPTSTPHSSNLWESITSPPLNLPRATDIELNVKIDDDDSQTPSWMLFFRFLGQCRFSRDDLCKMRLRLQPYRIAYFGHEVARLIAPIITQHRFSFLLLQHCDELFTDDVMERVLSTDTVYIRGPRCPPRIMHHPHVPRFLEIDLRVLELADATSFESFLETLSEKHHSLEQRRTIRIRLSPHPRAKFEEVQSEIDRIYEIMRKGVKGMKAQGVKVVPLVGTPAWE
jgi:hypothetical protein